MDENKTHSTGNQDDLPVKETPVSGFTVSEDAPEAAPKTEEATAPAGEISDSRPSDSMPAGETFNSELSESMPVEEQPLYPESVSIGDETPLSEGVSLTAAASQRKKKSGRKKQKTKKGCLVSFIWVAVVGIISLSLAALVLMTFTDLMGLGQENKGEVAITIPQGASTEQISEILKENDVIRYPFIYRIYSKLMKIDGKYQYGTYYLKPSLGYEGVAAKLQTIGKQGEQVKVRIPERANVSQIIDILVKNGVTTKKKFNAAMDKGEFTYQFMKDIPREKVYHTLEGYLYPETYMFYIDKEDKDDESGYRAIDTMLNQLNKKLTDADYEKAKKMGRTMHEILTMASIIELEASNQSADMPKVAQVFYNRLVWDEAKLLGSTPTAEYAKKTSERYDTNKYEGLPPGPYCSPSLNAIQAALNPDTSVKATYFVTDSDMNFYYTNTLSEHEAIIKKLKNQGKWEY